MLEKWGHWQDFEALILRECHQAEVLESGFDGMGFLEVEVDEWFPRVPAFGRLLDE